ncbi:F0F1 ATP synthase subunit B [Spiroplasma endosymbiont of Polydrusus formosus]|uniref:F0F1 ATP synthase subunit B n=1 Tax=Spiroplasma endosymbiont of Polydrusus formosus TaxID=3139326 RepID=UPI0035B5455E
MWLMSKPIEPSQIINQLFPNLWIFIAHIIATIILLILLSKWVYNPFRKAMCARRNKIRELIQDAAEKQAKATIDQKEASKLLTKAKVEANNIIASARTEVETKRHQVLETAKAEVMQLNEQAHKEIQKEKEQYYDDIRKSIINVAFNAAEQLLEKEISKEKNEKLVEEFIKELE